MFGELTKQVPRVGDGARNSFSSQDIYSLLPRSGNNLLNFVTIVASGIIKTDFISTLTYSSAAYFSFNNYLTFALNRYFVLLNNSKNIGPLLKPGTVMKSAHPEDFKTFPEI